MLFITKSLTNLFFFTLFCIFFQGVVFFIFHCVLDDQVTKVNAVQERGLG